MKKVFFSFTLIICLLLISATAYSQGRSRKHGRKEIIDQRGSEEGKQEPSIDTRLTVVEKGILLRHADSIIALPRQPKTQTQNLPPGLAKNVARGKRLPPGWQRKLIAGRQFPDSIYSQAITVPDHILRELPRQPEGTILVTIEDRIVRLREATRTIVDVFNLKL